jgi:putative restriction endonuclease
MVRPDLLKEPDGPMLRHGLQEFHGAKILVPGRPALQPNPEFLEERYAMFKGAA